MIGKRSALTAVQLATACVVSFAFHAPKEHLNPRFPSFNRARQASTALHNKITVEDASSLASLEPPGSSSLEPSSITQGSSAKAIKLRKQLQAIWTSNTGSTSPIILSGPKGSGKSELANEIVRNLPSWQTRTIHQLELQDALHFRNTILGTDTHPGLLDDLSTQSNTTLILLGFQSQHVDSKECLDRRDELMNVLHMLIQGQYFSVFENTTKPFLPRIIVCTSRPVDYFTQLPNELDAICIKVPSLESRKSDIKAIAEAKIHQLEGSFSLSDIQLSKEGRHRLLDHKWEVDGDAELEYELYRGLERLASEKKWNPFVKDILESRHLLVNAYNEKIRRRLLYDVPFLRDVIMSPWIFGKTLTYIVVPVFVLINAILFLGPQTREENAALTVFWAGWWPGIMIVFPFLGRIWCAICPFMAVGNLAQEVALKLGVKLKKWPSWAEDIGPVFAFGLFYAILMWEELWDLPQNGALSACLLLLITFGAVVNSIVYEKRLWCRYMCPIGAMNKMFATLSMTEVRTFKSNCEGCTTAECINGGSPTVAHDDYALKGCTMGLKNNQLRDMGDVSTYYLLCIVLI